ncbi:MAG: ThuA domain-containing protein [Verrucomicrobia bacterium]|nr:ThuA domain-containing protein [Verrucomicrobiota bacterium]
MKTTINLVHYIALALISSIAMTCSGAGDFIVFKGDTGPGEGKHIVLISGDEEYRSEEALPMLAKILASEHGYKCTVLFAIDPDTGLISPNTQNNIPGLKALETADLMVIATRFRELPEEQMQYIDEYVKPGKPIIGLRTATHAFQYTNKENKFAHYDWRSEQWPGGFGKQILGETWVNHHGKHGIQSTRAIPNPKKSNHPILTGVDDIWVPSDVYGLSGLPGDAEVLMHGQVLKGMNPEDEPVAGKQNDPLMPVAWIRKMKLENGATRRVFCTTMGASIDFKDENLRRLLVNAAYWATGISDGIPAKADVGFVSPFKPSYFGFNGYKKGMRPSDFKIGK